MRNAHRCALIAVTLALLWNTPSTIAWDSHGHMLVAAIAYQLLTPAVRARADALVNMNPSITKWRARIPKGTNAADRAAALFAIAATWPDEIKSAKGYTNDGNRPVGPNVARNVGYSDKLQHRYWHFIDQPFSTDGSSLPAVPTPNAVERVTLYRTTLASTAPDPLKSYDLVWLLHLVGDIHQPLHSATRVSATQPQGDNGGNGVALCAKPCTDVLHAFWDDALGNDEAPLDVLNAAKALTLPAPPTANDLDPMHWASDSLTLAKGDVYVMPPIGAGAGPFSTTPTYKASAEALSTKQIALAGARLAAILNVSLK
jgi:hypothetical protein